MIEIKKFSAEWCGPCRMVKTTFNEVKSEVKGVSFTDIDVDSNQEEAQKYGVRSIPLVVIEKDGVVMQRIQGSQPKSTYINAINGCR
jgi:thioredoxin 1